MSLFIEIESDALRANIAALQAMTRRTARESVRAASVMILQSGAKTVPQAGISKRKVVRAVRRYRRGVEELAIDARPEAPGDRALYLIARPRNRRPIGKSAGRKWWTFETLRAAQDHTAITFRGVVKAGFWSQYPAIGKAIPATYAKKSFLADVPGLKQTDTHLDDLVPEVTISNRSTAIGFDKATHWKTEIMSKVTNRIAGIMKANEQKLAAFRKAGGVTWNAEAGIYEGVEP